MSYGAYAADPSYGYGYEPRVSYGEYVPAPLSHGYGYEPAVPYGGDIRAHYQGDCAGDGFSGLFCINNSVDIDILNGFEGLFWIDLFHFAANNKLLNFITVLIFLEARRVLKIFGSFGFLFFLVIFCYTFSFFHV